MLLSQTLKEPFNSYSHMLPNNKAWATRIPYKNKEKELNTYTNCTALNNGWVWSIPLWSRIGTGYVYSDKYISDEDALVEFKKHLNRKDVDKLEFKNIKMRVGLHERLFVKNVCAIGLSAGFIEPLESNGLYTVHTFLIHLMKVLNRGNSTDISQFDKDTFNLTATNNFKNFAEFVALHYALSHRDDTPYWRDAKNKSYNTVDKDNHRISKFIDLINNKSIKKYYPVEEGISCVATGLNYFPFTKEDIFSDGYDSVFGDDLKNYVLKNTAHLDEQKQRWNDSVKNEKSIYEYLRDNIYNEKQA
jgi:tryptophan halogenase